MARDDDDGLGGRFWLKIFALLIAGAIGLIIVFIILGWALVSFGILGFFILVSVVLLGWGWMYDRREKKRHRAPSI